MNSEKFVLYVFLLVVAFCTLFLVIAGVPRGPIGLTNNFISQFPNLVPADRAPVIGIMTQGTTDMTYYEDYTMIASSYIKYIEAAGGKVVAVPYNVDEESLGRIYENINGLLVPGGRMKLVHASKETKDTEDPKMQMSMLARAVKYFVNRSVEDFHRGVYFPIFGICLGSEAVVLSLNEDVMKTMTRLDLKTNTYVSTAGSLTQEGAGMIKKSRLFKSFTDQELETFQHEAGFFFHHKYGITKETVASSQVLADHMIPLTALVDRSNRMYVTSYEVSNYPLFGVQFHPEKTSFEWHIKTDRSVEANIITHKLGSNFVAECRKNNHTVADRALIKHLGVYNYMTVGPKNGYSQLYYFSKDRVREAFESQGLEHMLV